MKTRKQRARYYAAGRVTVGTISTLVRKPRNTFRDWYVGKLRGVIVMHPKTRRWKFATPKAARAAAEAFKKFSAVIANQPPTERKRPSHGKATTQNNTRESRH